MIHLKPKQIQVKELIEILSKCDPKSWVCVGWCDEHWDEPDYDIYIGIEEYEDGDGRTSIMIGSEAYFNSEEEEEEDD